MSNVFNTRYFVSALYLVLLAGLPTAQAGVERVGVTVRVRIMVPPPCVVNKNNVIEVNFGNDVLTTRVDGVSYKRMPINYSVDCNSSYSHQAIMWIDGTPAEFNETMLATNSPNLGIALFENGNLYPINGWSIFKPTVQPRLEAVLAKRPGVTLKGGGFSAGATMRVEYL